MILKRLMWLSVGMSMLISLAFGAFFLSYFDKEMMSYVKQANVQDSHDEKSYSKKEKTDSEDDESVDVEKAEKGIISQESENAGREIKSIYIEKDSNGLDYLSIPGMGFTSVNGVLNEFDGNPEDIEGINLSRNTYLTDLSGIEAFSSLQYIYLGRTAISDLSPLNGCPNLEGLSVYDCKQLQSFDGFDKLNDIKYLEIGYQANDNLYRSFFESDSTYSNMLKLTVSEYEFDDVSFNTQKVPNLEALYANCSNINCNELSGLNRLSTLDISQASGSLDGMEELSSLRTLTVGNASDAADDLDIEFLRLMPYLTDVEIINVHKGVRSLSPLEDITDLKSLTLSGEFGFGLDEFNFIGSLVTLENLRLFDYLANDDLDYSFEFYPSFALNLRGLKILAVHIEGTDYYGWIESISGLESLRLVDIESETDLEFISNLSQLKKLSIVSGDISSIDELYGCSTLEEVNLNNSKIKSVLPLKNCPLKKLDLSYSDAETVGNDVQLEADLLQLDNADEELIIYFSTGSLDLSEVLKQHPKWKFYKTS